MAVQEGCFTVIFGVACFFLLPNSATSSSLLNEKDKAFIVKALHGDGIILTQEHDAHYTWAEVRRTFIGPHVLLVATAGFFSGRSQLLFR